MPLRFTIRDLLWLTLVAALAVGGGRTAGAIATAFATNKRSLHWKIGYEQTPPK